MNESKTKEYIKIPLNVSPKGVRTITIDLDEYVMIESGIKEKNGIPVNYVTYKIKQNG